MNDAKTYSRFIPDLLLTPEQAAREAKLDEALSGLSKIAADPEQSRLFREMLENEVRAANDATGEHQTVN